MTKTEGVSCVEQQVLAQLESRGATACDVCTSFGSLAAEWKLGTVHQLVNALLTLVDKGLLRQCETLMFCLTERGCAALDDVRAGIAQSEGVLPEPGAATTTDDFVVLA